MLKLARRSRSENSVDLSKRREWHADPTSFEWATVDDQGVPNRVQMYVAYDGSTETVDSLLGAWLAYGALIDPCIDGQIVDGQITIPLLSDASWKAAPVSPGNNSNQVMTLNFDNDFNTYVTPIYLPSYKESILVAKRPNIGANPLLALITAINAGSGAVFPNSKALHDLNALRDAFLGTRKLKKNKAATRVLG
jgi:hypothetical protein